ncbi:MAG: hypothetical protein Q7P63_05900 [Verrucomicrobiota bacterium JB022]|nr:hypothetical protein [Verrucomicrobiota bacterium JB022]
MSATDAQYPEIAPGIVPGQKYRFTVKSAQEAVEVIRERMGSKARVLEVNQVGGQGLSRFISSPKLEIIAQVPEEVLTPPEAPVAPEPATPPAAAATAPAPTEAAPAPAPVRRTGAEALSAYRSASRKETLDEELHRPPVESGRGLVPVLRRLGFDQALLSVFEGREDWDRISQLPLRRGLLEFTSLLRDIFMARPQAPLGSRIAFLGSPGCGKTTALCKRLTQDVIFAQEQPRVVKLENDQPNAGDALHTFCEVMGVNFRREPVTAPDLQHKLGRVYLDTPGLTLNDHEPWQEMVARLERLDVRTRVLVVNAAYDAELIKDQLAEARHYGATHWVLSHLDEVRSPARLWRPLLASELTPFFITHSQSVLDAIREDVFACLLERTFPPALLEQS